MIGKALPAQLAFVAIVGHGMLDRYPDLKVGFLEFGGEWILYSVGRMKQYMGINKMRMADPGMLPRSTVEDYVTSGRIYLGMESNDELMPQELALLGDGQLMYSSDFPHGEGRDTAAGEIIARTDITEDQKRRILYDNAADFYGAP
jgi:predicted TIM-barrel fold metal-dependent hydrolase